MNCGSSQSSSRVPSVATPVVFHRLFQSFPVRHDQSSDLLAARADDDRLRNERALFEQAFDLQRSDVFAV